MRIALGAGHTMSGKGTGAVGFINESKENREMFTLVKKWLEKGGHTVYSCNVDKADDYLVKQVNLANKQTVDLAVQIHFNAASTTNDPRGTETLYYGGATGTEAAKRVNAKLSTKFKNRGVKQNQSLYWLKNTKAAAILIEVCFVDSKADTNIYNANKDQIAKLIAEGIVGKTISGSTAPAPTPVVDKFVVGSYNKDVIVTAKDGLNARSGRGSEFSKLGAFAYNQRVNVWYIDKAKDGSLWGSCSCNGKTGYIHMGYVKAV